MKRARFVGTAKDDLSRFPDAARMRAGYELFMVQVGRAPADWKPMPGVGPGACEIRIRDASGAFRMIYVAKFADAIYVLHAFRKNTQKTALRDLELARKRYLEAKALAEG